MTSLRAVPSSGRLGGALGESNDVQLPFEHVPLRDSSHMAPCALSLHRPTGTDAAFSDADSSTVVRAHRSGSGDPAAPMSGSGSGSGGCSAGLSGGGAAPALSELLCRKPQPPRILHNPQQLHVIQSQRDMAAQLLGRSTVVMLPPPVQSLSLVCLLAETYLRTSGSDHRCLWLSSASTAHLTSAFEFHQRALPEHHLVLLDAEPRGSIRRRREEAADSGAGVREGQELGFPAVLAARGAQPLAQVAPPDDAVRHGAARAAATGGGLRNRRGDGRGSGTDGADHMYPRSHGDTEQWQKTRIPVC